MRLSSHSGGANALGAASACSAAWADIGHPRVGVDRPGCRSRLWRQPMSRAPMRIRSAGLGPRRRGTAGRDRRCRAAARRTVRSDDGDGDRGVRPDRRPALASRVSLRRCRRARHRTRRQLRCFTRGLPFRHNAGGAISFGPARAGGAGLAGRCSSGPSPGSGEDCYGFEADLADLAQVPSGQPMQLCSATLAVTVRASWRRAWSPSSGVWSRCRPFPPTIWWRSRRRQVLSGFALGQDAPSSGLVAFPLALAERYAGADAELH